MAVNFDTLASRAQKRVERRTGGKRPEWVLVIGNDEPDMVIPKPDAIVAMESEKAGSLYDQVRVLTGKEFPRILDLVRGKDIAVMQDLLTSMWDAWGDDSQEVAGGKEE